MTPHARSSLSPRRLLAQLVVVVTALTIMLTAAPAVAAPEPADAAAVTLDALKVERKVEPVGIDVAAPRFAWLVESSARDVTQESYRVRVSAADDVVWDSGVVDSERSFDVEYDGPALKAATRYDWTVDVVTSAGDADAS